MTTYADKLALLSRTPCSLAVLAQDYCSNVFGASPCAAISQLLDSYADYTEVDVGANRLVKTSNTVLTISDLDDDEAVYLYKNFGLDYFSGDFDRIFECNLSELSSGTKAGLITIRVAIY
jgi:hypothetical protein